MQGLKQSDQAYERIHSKSPQDPNRVTNPSSLEKIFVILSVCVDEARIKFNKDK